MALKLESTTSADNGGSANPVTSAITVLDGDILVAKSATEDQSNVPFSGVPTAPGQTFYVKASDTTSSYCSAQITTCTVTGSPGTLVVTQAHTGTGLTSLVVERWSGAQLATTPAVNATKLGTSTNGFSGAITTAANGSAVTWVATDWSANAPGTPAYRSSATQQHVHDGSTQFYVAYYAYQAADTAGAQTFGLTTPAGSAKWKYLAMEVQAAGGAPAYLFDPLMPPMNRH